ncbi:hypothetical protein GJ496_007662 [Pomphorhynchus laevis]|nr:hypothetical protein GJ496_007662 [Pomphorhynchus laevis]
MTSVDLSNYINSYMSILFESSGYKIARWNEEDVRIAMQYASFVSEIVTNMLSMTSPCRSSTANALQRYIDNLKRNQIAEIHGPDLVQAHLLLLKQIVLNPITSTPVKQLSIAECIKVCNNNGLVLCFLVLLPHHKKIDTPAFVALMDFVFTDFTSIFERLTPITPKVLNNNSTVTKYRRY